MHTNRDQTAALQRAEFDETAEKLTDARLRVLSAVADGQVSHRWIARNSGADHSQWAIDGQQATAYEVSMLVEFRARGWIGDGAGDRVSILTRGRSQLELAAAR